MLVFDKSLVLLSLLVREVLPRIREASLKSQLRRAAQAVPLLIAESRSARGARNPDGFSRALGEAREVKAALQVAAVMGYVDASEDVYDLADHVCAMLFKLSRG